MGKGFFLPQRWHDCVCSAWSAWFAPPDADPGSLVLVVTAGRRSHSGRLLAVASMAPSPRLPIILAPTVASGSPSEGLPTKVNSADASCPTSDSLALTSSVQSTAVTKDIPHDPMVHTDTSDVVEEAVEDASIDPKNFETAADRLASKDVPYDPMVHNDTSDMMEE
ncbi:hypothetical protein V6N11_051666 [Hibiscus sabdariffa]|uniref:Uncharacterized protein n=1 Tax=Hibiscus sabdariffa TaxID=183260 RepID=A0ABR2U8A7_9ROSI